MLAQGFCARAAAARPGAAEGIAEAPPRGSREPQTERVWKVCSVGFQRTLALCTSTVHCAGGLRGPARPGLPPCGSPSLPLLLHRVRGASGAGPVGHGAVSQLHREGAGGLPGRDGVSPSGLSENVGKVLFFSPSRSAFSRERSLLAVCVPPLPWVAARVGRSWPPVNTVWLQGICLALGALGTSWGLWDERIDRGLEGEPVGPCRAAVLGPEGGRVFGSPGPPGGFCCGKAATGQGSGIEEGHGPVGVKLPSPWTGVQGEGSLPGAWGVRIPDTFRRHLDMGLGALGECRGRAWRPTCAGVRGAWRPGEWRGRGQCRAQLRLDVGAGPEGTRCLAGAIYLEGEGSLGVGRGRIGCDPWPLKAVRSCWGPLEGRAAHLTSTCAAS